MRETPLGLGVRPHDDVFCVLPTLLHPLVLLQVTQGSKLWLCCGQRSLSQSSQLRLVLMWPAPSLFLPCSSRDSAVLAALYLYCTLFCRWGKGQTGSILLLEKYECWDPRDTTGALQRVQRRWDFSSHHEGTWEEGGPTECCELVVLALLLPQERPRGRCGWGPLSLVGPSRAAEVTSTAVVLEFPQYI